MSYNNASVIAVWGSPGSGKSTFSAILARYLTRDKSKAIIISPDQTVPMMPVWFPNENIENNMSLGHILTSSEINNSIIAERVKLLKSYPYVGVLGYTSGDDAVVDLRGCEDMPEGHIVLDILIREPYRKHRYCLIG